MPTKTYYEKLAKETINIQSIPANAMDRIGIPVKELLKEEHCIDVHTHFFDTKCVNSSYMVMRMFKDMLRMRGDDESQSEHIIESAYNKSDVYTDDWNDKLFEILNEDNNARGGKTSMLLIVLRMTKMKQVYEYYIKDASLATYFGMPKEKVLTTVLMMDFKMGWNVEVGKSIWTQIQELKELLTEKPVLPFLFCDPRRADLPEAQENLYKVFNEAFANGSPFFGVKIYPCLGYDPGDYRLWPIYEICEKLGIPVLSHCGGASVSTAERSIAIFEGTKSVTIKGKNRKEVAYQLNDPARWEKVLKRFPKLKLNIAHFGSDRTWSSKEKVSSRKDPQHRKEVIMGLMEQYPNVYADFSYTITAPKASKNFIALLQENDTLRKRSMFGSDYWVVYQEGDLKENQAKFLDMVDDNEIVFDLCRNNPTQYLFGTSNGESV